MSKTDRILKHAATLGPLGYFPAAPGTWGSAAGVLMVVLLPHDSLLLFFVVLTVVVFGAVASAAAERVTGEKDSGHIIIDEVAGMMVSTVFLPHTAAYLIAAFLLFRFFDILKPFPIRSLESSLKGGVGVMADDIAAGVMTNGVLQLWKTIS
ncbi:MAG: phosphatidylglycerophosphatase A family protein [Thermodesulfovibrionales bacterium]